LLIKEWEVANTGALAWPADCKLVLTRDSRALSMATEYPVPEAAPGQTVRISAVLQIPKRAGPCEAYFQLSDAEGKHFGPRMWVKLLVTASDGGHAQPEKEEKKEVVPRPPSRSSSSSENEDIVHVTVEDAAADDEDAFDVVQPMKKLRISDPPSSSSQAVTETTAQVPSSNPSPAASESTTTAQAQAQTQAQAPAPVHAFPAQMANLASMGFVNTEQNAQLLASFGGDLQSTITALLQ
jgi:hypothetical protein